LVDAQILRYVNELPRGSHVALFYDILKDKETILSEIVRDGLEQREIVCCLCSDVVETRDFLRRNGVGVDRHESNGLLEIDKIVPRDAHPLGIEFSSTRDNALLLWLKAYHKEKGNKPFRMICDEPLDFIVPTRLIKMENVNQAYFGRKAFKKLPAKLVCTYFNEDLAKIGEGQILFDLVKAHSHALFPGIALNIKQTSKARTDKPRARVTRARSDIRNESMFHGISP